MSLLKRIKKRLKEPKNPNNTVSSLPSSSSNSLHSSVGSQGASTASRSDHDLPVRPHDQGGSPTALPAALTSNENRVTLSPTKSPPPAPPSIVELRDAVWKRAIEKLRDEQEELMTAFEALVKEQNGLSQTTPLGADSMTKVAQKQKAIMESKQWTYTWFGLGKEHKVRDSVETIFGVIQQASGLISLGMQAAPPAVLLPWTMITILLPFVTNDIHAVDEAISGLQEVASILASYSYAELLDLYVSILEYQASVALYFAKNTLKRIGINLIPNQSWPEALAKTIGLEQKCQVPIHSLGVKLSQLGFQNVNSNLEYGLRLLKDISHAVTAGREYRQRIRRWISKIEPYDDHGAVRTRLGGDYSGSGQWLVPDETMFVSWMASPDRTLLLQGIVGSGKSCLTSIVIESLLTRSPGSVAFMYCSADVNPSANTVTETNRSTTLNVLRCILSQLITLPDGSVARSVQEAYEREVGGNSSSIGGGLSFTVSLIKALLQERRDEQHTFVFDALDECVDYDELLQQLVDVKSKFAKLRFFFSARNGVQIGSRFPQHEAISITSGNTRDLETYVDHEVAKRYEQVGMQLEQAERLKKALLRLAGGMSVPLGRARACGPTSWPSAQKRRVRTRDVDNRLQKLESSNADPIDLLMGAYDQIYEMALGRPDEEANRATVTCALKWVLCSLRPLTSEELLQAVSVQEDGTFEDDLAEEDVLEPCSNLFVKDVEGVIRLAHLSVRQYFETKHAEQYRPGLQHHQATQTSFWMISTHRDREQVVHRDVVSSVHGLYHTGDWRSWSFTTYCRHNWIGHYKVSEQESTLKAALHSTRTSLDYVFSGFKNYIMQVQSLPAESGLAVDGLYQNSVYHSRTRDNTGLQPEAFWTWIRFPEQTTVSADIQQPRALILAGKNRDDVTSSLDLELDIRDTDGAGNTAMHYAAFFDQPLIIRDLLRMGALVEQQNLSGHTPMDVGVQALSYDSVLVLYRAGYVSDPGSHIPSRRSLDSSSTRLIDGTANQAPVYRQPLSFDTAASRPKVTITKDAATCSVCDFSTWIEGSRYAQEFPVTWPSSDDRDSSTCELCMTVRKEVGHYATDVKVRVLLDCDSTLKSGKDLVRYSAGQKELTFELYCDPTDIEHSKADTVIRGLGIDTDYAAKIREWLHTCESHECSSPAETSDLPLRLLDLSPGGVCDRVRLCNTDALSTRDIRYVYLSFTWGTRQPKVKLHRENLEQFYNEIEYTTLPALISDTIQVCRDIGYRYLFVDMLCLIQEEETDDVWHTPRAAHSLSNAHLVIVSNGGSVYESLFPNETNFDKRPPLKAWVDGNEKAPFNLRIRNVLQSARFTIEDKVLSRAWRQQETFMATRLVVFGKQQIYWSCGESLAAQDDLTEETPWTTIPAMRRESRNIGQVLSPDMVKRRKYRYWYQLVEANMRGQLTVKTDRPYTISNLAREMSRDLGENTYIAGLWQGDIRNGLLWVHKPTQHSDAKERVRDTDEYTGPSWSWGSGSGQVSYGLIPGLQAASSTGQHDSQFAIRDKSVLLSHSDAYGAPMEGSSLTIAVLSLTAEKNSQDYWGQFEVFLDHLAPDGALKTFIFAIVAPWTYSPQGDSRWAGLVLAKLSTTGDEEQYERVGVFLGPLCDHNLDRWEFNEFVLI